MSNIELIKSCGYRVFVRKLSAEYCFYTDGTNIGYAQWSGYRESVNTVHKANLTTGTGFHFADAINAETIKGAIACFAPQWARQRDIESINKWANWDAFHIASNFNREFFEV